MKKQNIFKNCYLIEFSKYGDNQRGFLTVFEENIAIPFKIKRVYYIYDIGNPLETRGPHAHRKTAQVFINIRGKATYLLDNGIEKKKIILDKPNIGLYIGPKVWHYINEFSADIIILTVASTLYNEDDYIRDYNDFMKYVH